VRMFGIPCSIAGAVPGRSVRAAPGGRRCSRMAVVRCRLVRHGCSDTGGRRFPCGIRLTVPRSVSLGVVRLG
jgi:hypothetical protein